MRGPKPTAPPLRLIKGKPKRTSAKPRPAAVHLPPAREPVLPPDHLDAGARAEWDRIIPLLGDLVLPLDRAVLAAYCVAVSRFAACEAAIAKLPSLTFTTSHGSEQPHPLLALARRASIDIGRFAEILGLSPAARSRLAIPPPVRAGPEDPAAQYFD